MREAERLRDELVRHAEWVERTLRTHSGEGARGEVLFSPLRLDSRVLEAVVAVGNGSRRYALHPDSDPDVTREHRWTTLASEPSRGDLAARRGLCDSRSRRGPARAPCLWLRFDAQDQDAVLGFTLWVAYRASSGAEPR